MTSATERIRAMLDERGVEWGASDTYRLLVTSWNDVSGHSWAFMEHRDGSFSKLTAYHITPEQAIAATLGTGTCHNVNHGLTFVCSECGANVDTASSIGYSYVDEFGKRWYGASNDYGLNYCPNCGRKVVAE